MAPVEKNAMVPSTELYVHSFSELDVPAYPRPSAIRSLTGRAIEVFTTASTYIKGAEFITSLTG